MTKNEIIEECMRLLFEESRHLSREDYRELLEEVGSDIDLSLDSLNEEDYE